MKNFAILIVSLFYLVPFYGKAPIKYGKVDKEMLLMDSYEADTSAAAVILCDYGEFDPDQIQFTRNLRIKILKKDGLEYAKLSVPSGEKGMVSGLTFNLVDGNIEKTKLDKKDDVFRERVYDDRYQLRISMPNVKVGSVLDIEYSFSGMPYVWEFQNLIPTMHSELVLYESPYITFTKNFFGFERLDVSEGYRWAIYDVPAFKKESYMNNYENYITKFEIEVSQITIPSIGFNKTYATSWDAIRKHLYESQYFGGKFGGNYFLKSIAKEIEEECDTDEEKLAAAVKHIKTVKWDNKKRVTCTSYSLNDRYSKKLANSAELNIMLIELAKDMGFEAKPVVMSTRDNGFLSHINPSLYKLNYVIALVKTGDKEYLLDATDKYLNPLALPRHCLNYQGRVLSNETNDWVIIKPVIDDDKSFMYNLKMDATGKITGTLSCKNIGYAARDVRSKYYSFSSEDDFIIDLEKKHSNFDIIDYKLTGLDNTEEDISENYNIEIDTKGNRIGSMILINPLFNVQLKENPFKLDVRKYPVDFIHNTNRMLIFSIQLPDNATVKELPAPSKIVFPDNSLTALYNVVQNGNMVQVIYKYNVNKTIFNEGEYPVMKEFFAAMVQKHAENIIIELNETEPSAEL